MINRLTERDLSRIVKRVVNEEECLSPPSWLETYKIDGRLGKQQCSNWEWRDKRDDNKFLWISFNQGFFALGIYSDSVTDEELEELLDIFGMSETESGEDDTYRFQYNFSDTEEGGDLNQKLDELQGGKIPWISTFNESYIRKMIKRIVKEEEDRKKTMNDISDDFLDDTFKKISRMIMKPEFSDVEDILGKTVGNYGSNLGDVIEAIYREALSRRRNK